MKFTTMIVDDDEICLLVHKHIIEKSDFDSSPQIFDGALKAMEYIRYRSEMDLPVLVFLDINMPIMTGWDLLDILHSDDDNKELRVIVVSSSVNDLDKQRAFSFSKVIDFIEKPLDRMVIEKLKIKLDNLSEW